MLSPAEIDAVAEATAARLSRGVPELLTVADVAACLKVEETFVRRHKVELGAIKLGTGRTSPIRFTAENVRQWIDQQAEGNQPKPTARRYVPQAPGNEHLR